MTPEAKASRPRLPIVLAAAGFVLSALSEVVHVRTYLQPSANSYCTVGEQLDCTVVALSRFSVVLGVPLPVWGMLGFLAIFTAATRRSRLFFPLSAAAAVASLLLLVESIVSIRSLCLLCEGVHGVAFALVWLAWREHAQARTVTRDDAIAILGIPGGILLAARLFLPPYWAMIVWKSGIPYPTGIDDEGNRWIGAVDPAVTVHEFVDYHCPHCAVSAGRMRMRVTANPGKLRVVRRFQPRVKCLGESAHVCAALRAALCAGEQDKFWEMDSWLFTRAPGKAKIDVAMAADELGLDLAQLEICMMAPQTWDRARAEAEAARKAGVKATPGYVVDGEKLDPAELSALLDERL